MTTDILLTGTGGFAGRIAFDIAATAKEPVHVTVAGRNRDRLRWLVTAGNGRAALFGTPARFAAYEADLLADGVPDAMIAALAPKIVAQAASVQTSQVIASRESRWARLVADGGLAITAPSQALLSIRVAEAITRSGRAISFFNCGFPDVVNGLIRALGHGIVSGFGNIAILSNAFAGHEGIASDRLKMLAHYQNLATFRQAPAERSGSTPRVFVDGAEVADVYARYRDVQLTREPAIELSGASGVPLLLALAAGKAWTGHVPGPNGLPGGYPVRLEGGALVLDLPDGVTEAEAVAFNAAYEANGGMVVEGDDVIFTGKTREALARYDAAISGGFAVADTMAAIDRFEALRASLSREAAA
ncbi:hypothetical protein [Acuticoccus kandeliae]|uniref:hypothetical protein n=1 Tax=Acuticoccus kandeliae TaxID=2073160 RepID=UPI000D3EBCD9|nr:hypothetical protein [Acuticoccus kandeliae]